MFTTLALSYNIGSGSAFFNFKMVPNDRSGVVSPKDAARWKSARSPLASSLNLAPSFGKNNRPGSEDLGIAREPRCSWKH